MKNAALLLGIWLGIIVFAYSVAYLSGDRLPVVALPGDAEIVSRAHGLAVSLPPAWSYRAGDPADALVAPVAGVRVWALDVDAASADVALRMLWEAIDPCSSCERPSVLTIGPLGDGREGVLLLLGPDEDGNAGRATVVYVGESARVLFVQRAPGAELPARIEGDLARIEASFRGFEIEPSSPAVPADEALEPSPAV